MTYLIFKHLYQIGLLGMSKGSIDVVDAIAYDQAYKIWAKYKIK